MTEIKWEEPEPDRKAPGKYVPLADALRANPGQWAVFSDESFKTVVGNIHRGSYKGLTPGEFEAVSKGIPGTGKCKVWIRYVGKRS